MDASSLVSLAEVKLVRSSKSNEQDLVNIKFVIISLVVKYSVTDLQKSCVGMLVK